MENTGTSKSESRVQIRKHKFLFQQKRHSCPDKLEFILDQNNRETSILTKSDLFAPGASNKVTRSKPPVVDKNSNVTKNSTLKPSFPSGLVRINLRTIQSGMDKHTHPGQNATPTSGSSVTFAKRWKWLLKKYRNHKMQTSDLKCAPNSHQAAFIGGRLATESIRGCDSSDNQIHSIKQRKSSVS
ncbi:hypothetical protein FBUS_03569 [Fasciolopsis buskii]|uniref:Uncharacterized protein n=1 Tax=Fasciolopsis buskii TaxID=27845 RepID=A0A8E0VJ60_9TREM|nr:hypothetical protein FBUS_03569 [Fasciolopsis buski]